MARVTVEDCLRHVDNRFELVMLGARRARQLSVEGKQPLVEESNDKSTVVALREIAEGVINRDLLDAEDARTQAELERKRSQFETRQHLFDGDF